MEERNKESIKKTALKYLRIFSQHLRVTILCPIARRTHKTINVWHSTVNLGLGTFPGNIQILLQISTCPDTESEIYLYLYRSNCIKW